MGRAADPDEATTQPLRRLPCDAQSPLGPSAEAELLRVFAHLPSRNAWSDQSQAGAPASLSRCFSRALTRLGQPDGISPSRMAEMLEVDKAGPKVRC
jgi:hypothetical protein